MWLFAVMLHGGYFVCATAPPENDSLLKDTILLSEVKVVSGTKTEVNRSMVPLTLSVIHQETLDKSTETGLLSILSESIPGLFVTERGVTGYGISTGSAGTVSIHGVGNGNQILMMFDGQPVWAGIFGHHIPDAYVASDAERVEVIRGPGSLLYGSNAMGGVINVITRKAAEDGFHGRGRIMYGSYNTQKYLASAGYKKDKLNIYLSLNRDQSDGHRKGSDFYVNNGYLRMGYMLSDHWDLSGNVLLAQLKVDNPGAVTWPMYDNFSKALRSTYSFSVSNRYEKMNGAVQGFYNRGKHEVNDGYTPTTTPRDYLFYSDDYTMGLSAYESFRLFPANLFTIGLDAKRWGGNARNDFFHKPDETIIDTYVNEVAGYFVMQHTLLHSLTLNAGVRLEHNGTYGNEWVPQGGITYSLHPQTSFKASVSKGFRSPNLRELYLFMPANPNLRPERMNNVDFSYLQSLWNHTLEFELTGYYAKGSNLIRTTMVEGRPLNVNTGKFTNKGIDFSFSYQPYSSFKLHGNYSFLHSDIEIEGAPKHKMFLSADWTIDKFTFSPGFHYINGLYLAAYTPEQAPPSASIAERYENYGLLSVKALYKPQRLITFFLNGENLTDTSYQTYTGFPMPGIVVLGGMDIRF